MKIDEFTDYADKIVNEEIPSEVLRDLNLGIIVIPDVRWEDKHYIMGEYVLDEAGRHIVLYFGSFAAVLDKDRREIWKEEIRETIRHELQHHIEDLAGSENLARREALERKAEKLKDLKGSSQKSIINSFLHFIKCKKSGL